MNAVSPFIEITNKKIEEINEILGSQKDNINKLNEDLIISLGQINKDLNPSQIKILKNYESKIKTKNKIAFQKKYTSNIKDEKEYDKLIYYFIYKKNVLLKQNIENKNIDSLISKIFLFGIKYYNCYDKLNKLLKEIKPFKKEEIQENFSKIQSIKSFSLFYSFYEASCRIKIIYHKYIGKIKESAFVEEEKNFFEKINKKIEYLYNIIVPSDDNSIQPNISIINNILDIIGNEDIELEEVRKFTQLQNISCEVKLFELIIINNLLLCLNSENNIIFLLNLICRKIRQVNNKLNSFFDNTYGADYFIMEKLKNQFHIFLRILSYKIINGKNQYSITTQISLTENLMWKIRGRNFPVLLEIIKVFEEIKKANKKTINKGFYFFEHNNIYNIKYFNERKSFDIKIEVFKILVSQIIIKIKDLLKTNEEDKSPILIERNPSNISDSDYKEMLKIIISYFVDIEPDCLYYNELILFFYKIFINSKMIQNFLLSHYPNVISKIMVIIFHKEDINNKENDILNNYNILIMINLFSQILENIKEYYLDYLIKCINIFEKKNTNIENPLVYLYEKLIIKLKNNYLNRIINKYYHKLLLICLNKLFEFGANENYLKQLINNLSNIIFLLFSDKCSDICGNSFINKIPYSNNFEEESLFYSDNREIDTGKILCYLQYKNSNQNFVQDFNQKIKFKSISKYLNDNSINYFDQNIFKYHRYNKKNKCNEILMIMDDIIESDYYKNNNIEIKYISEVTTNKKDNYYQKLFIKNNSKIIINIIKEIIGKNTLNEKGFCFLLKILSKVINYLNKEDILIIFKYIWNYYEKNKKEENNYIFMSLEFIEEIIDKYYDFYNQSHLNIFKEINNDDKSIYQLFNYIIKKNSFSIYSKTNNNINSYHKCLKNPIIDTNINENIKAIYDKVFKLSNISFHNNLDIINDNSVLFTKPINDSNDLLDLSKIIKNNNNKIKVIITNEINEKLNQSDLEDFINNNSIPIYKIEYNIYKILIDFFIKGNGANYIYLKNFYDNTYNNENNRKKDNNIIDIYKFNLNINNEDESILIMILKIIKI